MIQMGVLRMSVLPCLRAAICVHTEYSFTDKPTSSIITVRKDGKIYDYNNTNDVENFVRCIDTGDKEWRKRGKGHPFLVLHSCSTSQCISAYKEFKDVIIIAPDATLYSSLKGEHIGGIATGKNWEQKKEENGMYI